MKKWAPASKALNNSKALIACILIWHLFTYTIGVFLIYRELLIKLSSHNQQQWPLSKSTHPSTLACALCSQQVVFTSTITLRPNIKHPVLRVARHYIHLLVKPRICFRFSGKKIRILKGKMPFKMHKIIYFFQKKKKKKNMCAFPT